MGHYSTALNRYTKSREYCTTSQHGLDSDMCLSALEVCVLFYSLSTHWHCFQFHHQLLIEQHNYTPTSHYLYAFKGIQSRRRPRCSLHLAKSDQGTAGSATSAPPTAFSGTQQKLKTTGTAGPAIKRSIEYEKAQSKLDFTTVLSHSEQVNYEKAAFAFLRLGNAKGLGDWLGTVSSISSFRLILNTGKWV